VWIGSKMRYNSFQANQKRILHLIVGDVLSFIIVDLKKVRT